MEVKELNRNQLRQLKSRWLIDKRWSNDESVYESELMDIDDVVSDEEMFEAYEGIYFVEDDFWKEEE